MEKFELIFIPSMGAGHLASIVEMANIVVTRDHRLSITVLILRLPDDAKIAQQIPSLVTSFPGKSIRFIILPEPPLLHQSVKKPLLNLLHVLESYKPHVREAVAKLAHPRLLGFVVDMLCATMVDVADEFEVPCYVFYTSCGGSLSLLFHLQQLYDQNNSNEALQHVLLQSSDGELAVKSFVNPIPRKVIPSHYFDYESAVSFYDIAKKYRSRIKGLLVNSFAEMESHIMKSMSSASSSPSSQVLPPLFFVGPVLHLKNNNASETPDNTNILKWLDNQPPSAVVFLCFGSMGCFKNDQVEEIASGLEQSGARFVWSLRRPPLEDNFEAPTNYTNIKDVLPEGFLDRTEGMGKVIGWAPQVEILAHPAIGGFVSHCGWNSILESVWHGVPIATWPMYAEQQQNAFEMVVELELAIQISIDYQMGNPKLVSAKEIESGIRKLMEDGNEIRRKVKAKSVESRKSVVEGGSSFISLGHFIDDLFTNLQHGGD